MAGASEAGGRTSSDAGGWAGTRTGTDRTCCSVSGSVDKSRKTCGVGATEAGCHQAWALGQYRRRINTEQSRTCPLLGTDLTERRQEFAPTGASPTC